MNQQALPLAKNLIIPGQARSTLAERHRVRRQPGYYAGQTVSLRREPTAQVEEAVILEMHGQQAELDNGLRLPTGRLTLVASDEAWRPVEAFDGRYLISNHGKVVSTLYQRTTRERVMRHLLKQGHAVIRLTAGTIREDHYIGRLVALHFLPAPHAEAKMISYRDRNPLNLHYNNLEWVVAGADNPLVGRASASGEGHYSTRLSDEQIKEMRDTYQAGGVTHKQLAKKYGVSRESVTALLNNRSRSAEPQKVTPRLDDIQVAEIRATYAQGGISCERLGQRYGVSSATISRLTANKSRPAR